MSGAITPTMRRLWIVLLLAMVAVCAASLKAQRRRLPQPRPTAAVRIDYFRFSHATKQHQEACKTCHKAPTSNWQKARGFPDVADYPDHDACVRCHRPQFFKGAQPVICTDCHTKVSPRDELRFAFRHPNRPQQFKIEFPHDKHQDVIASLRREPESFARLHSRRTARVAFAHAAQTKTDYNYCTICHTTNTREPGTPDVGWPDSFVPKPDSFKAVPLAHSACFNCHWKNQEPTKDNCLGCHKLSSPYIPATAPNRKSLKFTHSREQHVAECTTCHINITKASSLVGLKPDVPITSCTTSSCHNSPPRHQEVLNELAQIDKNNQFVCSYCHTSNVGKLEAPTSHYHAVEGQSLKPRNPQ